MSDGTDLVQALMDTLKESEDAVRQMRRGREGLPDRAGLQDRGAPGRGDSGHRHPRPSEGDADVAALRFVRDMSRSEWEADRSNSERLKNQAWIIERQIDREMRP